MGRTLGLGVAVVAIFAAVCAILLRFMTPPLKDSDYLIAGSVATLVSLAALFVLVIATSPKGPGVFFKRRRR